MGGGGREPDVTDKEESVSGYRVKIFPKIEFDYHGLDLSFCGIDEVFSDASARDEAHLVNMDE